MTTTGQARDEALKVLQRVRQNVPVAEALAASHRATAMSANDRALMTQLVYGVLRHRRYLDALMEPFLQQALEPDVREILRMAFFQLRFLDRVPAYAVVNAAVEQTKVVQPKASRMVNAILRRGQEYELKDPPLAVAYSHPDWLVARWAKRFGDRLGDILKENNRIPPLTLRINRVNTTTKDVLAALNQQGIEAAASEFLPEAVRVFGSVWLEDWALFQEGKVSVQDESGMLVSRILDPQPGDLVLDVAAGVGGKTGHIAELTAGQAEIVAVDVSDRRLGLLRQNLSRLGMASSVKTIVGDARNVVPDTLAESFDRVLVDAPCSNLGVLRRRVDARWKKSVDDFATHQRTQTMLLEAAVLATKPGGVIVYSTCSIEPEETTEVVSQIQAQFPHLLKESVTDWLPHPALQQAVMDGTLTIVPGDFGMDGFFIARFRKLREKEKLDDIRKS